MRKLLILELFALIVSTVLMACSGPSPANNASTNNNTNTVTGTNNAVATTKKTEAPTNNDAPTLGPVIQAYYDALKKKDDAAVRQIMSTDFIKRSEDGMKEEKQKSLTAYLAEYDTLPDKPLETRNEKIDGDKGVAELRGGAYRTWTAFAFVKENGKWKLTGGSPEIDSVKQQTNSAK